MNTPEPSGFFSRKSLLLLFFLISSLIIIVSYAYILNYSKSFQENTAKQLTTIADLKIREIVDWRNARLGDASLFYKNRNFSELALRYLHNPLDREARKSLLSWMAKVNSAYKYNRLEIYDSNFNFRIAYPEGIGREEHSFFKNDEKDLRSGKIVFKDFYRDEHDKKIYMMLLVPLYNELSGGKFMGTLAMRIDPKQHLYPYINQWPVPAVSAEALLARREGDYAVYLNELRFRKDAPLELRVPLTATEFAVTRGALNQEGVAEALDYKGDRVIAAIKRIPDTPWFIVAHISKSEVTAPYIGRLWTVIFIALLMIVTAGIIILLFRKHYDTQIYLKQLYDAELLTASEERFRNLHESMIDAFVQVNMDGRIISCNSAFMEVTGYTFEELKELTYFDLTPEKWHSNEADIVEKQIIKKGFSEIYEKEYRRKDGTLVPVELRTSLLKDSTGKPSGMWAIVRDITERKKSADLLNTRVELLNYADDHTVEEILIRTLDEVERFTSSTISFFHFLDDDQKILSLQAWSTGTIEKFCKAEGRGMHYNVSDAGVWTDAVREQKVVIHNDYMGLPQRKGLPQGHAEVIREMVIPIIRDQSIKGILGVGNKSADYNEKDVSITAYFADTAWDLIERRRNMEYLEKFNIELENRVSERTSALEKANRELDSFTYSISHDLRAPLRHITGFIGMLHRELGEFHNEKVRHFMDVIDQSAKRMAELIDDLLSFSRLGRAELSVKNVNMESLLDEVISDYADEINQGKVSITRHPLPDVTGDRSMLRVVLVNLLSNAIKFSSKEAKPGVEIGCEKGDTGDIFYIRDNGAGFDMHYAEQLFGVFQRLHNEKDFPGTGIGLAMVRSIIERHNGEVHAESEPGMGACFYFTLSVYGQ